MSGHNVKYKPIKGLWVGDIDNFIPVYRDSKMIDFIKDYKLVNSVEVYIMSIIREGL